MDRKRLIAFLAVLVILVALYAIPAQATRVIGPYQRIYEGIDYAQGTDDTPRLMKAFVTRVDLENPYVSIYASHDNGSLAYEVTRETPTAFLASHGCKVAVNASFFNAGLSPNTDIWGLLVSNGTVVSAPDYASPFNSQLSFTTSNYPSLTVGNTVPPGAYNAVAGAEVCLSNGQVASGNTDVQPRTFMGFSADRRYLIMICVDGRQPGWSMGCHHPEAAQWLLDFGAWDGVIMDGGGSTVMVRQDVGVVNSPSDGSVRAVGCSLGVLSENPDYIIDNPAGTWSANWTLSTGSTQKYGADYRWRATAAVSDAFTWRPNLLTAGNYEVYAWWTTGSNRSTTAPYVVYYDGGNTTVRVNQQAAGGQWNSLGTYPFAAGTNGNVKLSCWTTAGFVVVADAVRFVKR